MPTFSEKLYATQICKTISKPMNLKGHMVTAVTVWPPDVSQAFQLTLLEVPVNAVKDAY